MKETIVKINKTKDWFFEHLRKNFILLLLDGMSYIYQLGPSGLMCHLKVAFPY